MPKKKNNYVNNKKFYECMVEYSAARKKALEEGRPQPPIPDYAGYCIKMICERMGSRFNFSGYSFRDELVGDAIADCVYGFYKFDADRFNNPFGYFSRISWYAMIRKIVTERVETYVKHKSLQRAFLEDQQWDSPEDWTDPRATRIGGVEASSNTGELIGTHISDQVVADFENFLARRRQKKVKEPSK